MSNLILYMPLPATFQGLNVPSELVGRCLNEIRQDKALFVLLMESIYEHVQQQHQSS